MGEISGALVPSGLATLCWKEGGGVESSMSPLLYGTPMPIWAAAAGVGVSGTLLGDRDSLFALLPLAMPPRLRFGVAGMANPSLSTSAVTGAFLFLLAPDTLDLDLGFEIGVERFGCAEGSEEMLRRTERRGAMLVMVELKDRVWVILWDSRDRG